MNQIAQLEKLIKIQELIGKADAAIVEINKIEYYKTPMGRKEKSKDLKTAQEVMERIESYYNTKLLELYQSRVQELMPEELTQTNCVEGNLSPQEQKAIHFFRKTKAMFIVFGAEKAKEIIKKDGLEEKWIKQLTTSHNGGQFVGNMLYGAEEINATPQQIKIIKDWIKKGHIPKTRHTI